MLLLWILLFGRSIILCWDQNSQYILFIFFRLLLIRGGMEDNHLRRDRFSSAVSTTLEDAEIASKDINSSIERQYLVSYILIINALVNHVTDINWRIIYACRFIATWSLRLWESELYDYPMLWWLERIEGGSLPQNCRDNWKCREMSSQWIHGKGLQVPIP